MPSRRNRRNSRRTLPAVVAVIIGLAIGGGLYWHQHPDLELRVLQNPIDWVADAWEEREARARLEAQATLLEIEQEIHVGINIERIRTGGAPLNWDEQLAAVARAHSDDMSNRGYFSHDTPEGLGPSDRIDRAGYSCWKGTHYGVAENIAIETTLGDPERTAAEAVRGWVNSPGHRTNLLGKQYDRTGVGASSGKWSGYEAVYLTQVFC